MGDSDIGAVPYFKLSNKSRNTRICACVKAYQDVLTFALEPSPPAGNGDTATEFLVRGRVPPVLRLRGRSSLVRCPPVPSRGRGAIMTASGPLRERLGHPDLNAPPAPG